MTPPLGRPARRARVPRLDVPAPAVAPAVAIALACLAAACATTSTGSDAGSSATGAPVRGQERNVVASESEPSAQSSIEDEEASEAGAASEASSALPIHGYSTTAYRARWNGDETDHDLYEVFSIDVGDPARNPWTGHAMTRIRDDLDGQEAPSSPYFDLDDTFDGTVDARLYDAFAQYNGKGWLDYARIGRQSLWDTPVFAWFDGVSAQTRESETRSTSFGAYGGIPVHMYESSHGGDLIAGAYAQARPWTEGRVRLDWMHLQDEGDLGSHKESLWQLGLWQGVSEDLQLEGNATVLGGEQRDWSVGATWRDPSEGLTLQANYFRLLETQRDLPPEIDPFFAALAELFPYHQARLLAAKEFGAKVAVTAGVDARRMVNEGDEGQFNRDFERAYSTVQLRELLPAELVLDVTGELWDSDGSEYWTWGLDLSRAFAEKVDASIGSVYALYKVDSLTSEERDDVRTWYARVRWKQGKAVRWDLRYDVEDSDIDTFQSLKVGMTWRF